MRAHFGVNTKPSIGPLKLSFSTVQICWIGASIVIGAVLLWKLVAIIIASIALTAVIAAMEWLRLKWERTSDERDERALAEADTAARRPLIACLLHEGAAVEWLDDDIVGAPHIRIEAHPTGLRELVNGDFVRVIEKLTYFPSTGHIYDQYDLVARFAKGVGIQGDLSQDKLPQLARAFNVPGGLDRWTTLPIAATSPLHHELQTAAISVPHPKPKMPNDASFWALSGRQLTTLAEQIKRAFPTEQPSMSDIVKRYIKPLTLPWGVSYAVMINHAAHLRADAFVSHGWAESFDEFVEALQRNAVQDRPPLDLSIWKFGESRPANASEFEIAVNCAVEAKIAEGFLDDFRRKMEEDEKKTLEMDEGSLEEEDDTFLDVFVEAIAEAVGIRTGVLHRGMSNNSSKGKGQDDYRSEVMQLYKSIAKAFVAVGSEDAIAIGTTFHEMFVRIGTDHSVHFDEITFWICSLGVEQNGSIAGQLGNDIRESPFARVLENPSVTCVYAVQNSHLDMYTRVWCVYECYLSAEVLKKKVVPIGQKAHGSVDIRSARASVQTDKDKIMTAIAGFEDNVNAAVGFIKQGETLHSDDKCTVM